MVTVVATVYDGVFQRLLLRQGIKDLIKARSIMTLVPCDHKRHASGFVYTAGMDCGEKSTPRAAQALGRLTAVFLTHQPHADGRAQSLNR
jgi:hypothetical protein